jgi:hypothetical protein
VLRFRRYTKRGRKVEEVAKLFQKSLLQNTASRELDEVAAHTSSNADKAGEVSEGKHEWGKGVDEKGQGGAEEAKGPAQDEAVPSLNTS